jgi:hypothetical protein
VRLVRWAEQEATLWDTWSTITFATLHSPLEGGKWGVTQLPRLQSEKMRRERLDLLSPDDFARSATKSRNIPIGLDVHGLTLQAMGSPLA